METEQILGQEKQPQKEQEIKRVAILSPRHGGLHNAAARSLETLGITVEEIDTFSPDVQVDRLLFIGPMQHYSGQIASLRKHKDSLPPMVFWFTEQIPRFPLVREFSKTRALLDRVKRFQDLPGNRFRRVGELLALNRLGDLTVHTFSETNTRFMGAMGLKTHTTPFGYYPELGRVLDEDQKRDVDVIFIGNTRPPRGPLIDRLAVKFHHRQIGFAVHDGGRKYERAIYGEKRTEMLNRSKIMLGIPQRRWDDIHFRFLLAGANGTMMIAPPLLPKSLGPFSPGEDFIEVPIEKMPDKIKEYLENPEQIKAIAHSLHEKVMSMPLEEQIGKVLGLSGV